MDEGHEDEGHEDEGHEDEGHEDAVSELKSVRSLNFMSIVDRMLKNGL